MGARAEALATQLEQANDDVIRAVEVCSDEQWKRECPEGRPVNVLANHVAAGHEYLAGLVQMMANGQPLPAVTMDDIHAGNAQAARQTANITREEALAALRGAGPKAAQTVRGLSDEQLDRGGTLFGRPMTTEQFIQNIMIVHPREHLQSIQQGMGA
jgi:hypothetical protein